MRAGSLRQKLETLGAVPPPAPARPRLRSRRAPRADAVRVLWPSGIAAGRDRRRAAAAGAAPPASPIDGARPQAVLVPVSSSPGTASASSSSPTSWAAARWATRSARRVGTRPIPTSTCASRGDQLRAARRPLRAARHQRARGGAVPRSARAYRGRPPGGRRECIPNEGHDDAAEARSASTPRRAQPAAPRPSTIAGAT